MTVAGFSATTSFTGSAGFSGSLATGLTVLGAGVLGGVTLTDCWLVLLLDDCCGDFLQEGMKHIEIVNNTQIQIFTIELKLFVIISFYLKNPNSIKLMKLSIVNKLSDIHKTRAAMLSYL